MDDKLLNEKFANLNYGIKHLSGIFDSAMNGIDEAINSKLTNKQKAIYKEFSGKYMTLISKGEKEEAEKLRIKFENEQF